MHKPDIELAKPVSLKISIQNLMQVIVHQKFHLMGPGILDPTQIGEDSNALPSSLADAVEKMRIDLKKPIPKKNIELLKSGQNAQELKRAKALAVFAAALQVATETNHPSRHPETHQFYQNCIDQIFNNPLLKEGGLYHEEFRQMFESSLEKKRYEIINPKCLEVIHQVERVFKILSTLEEHLAEYIPDLATTEDPGKHFLLTVAKQSLLCRSKEELNQCVKDFKLVLKHSGLPPAQQEQLTADIENYQGNYKRIFNADQRQLKLIGAAALHVGAIGTDVGKSIMSAGILTMSTPLKDMAKGVGFGVGALGIVADQMKESASAGYSNIVQISKELPDVTKKLPDLLAPYLLNTTGKSVGEKVKEKVGQAFKAKIQAFKEKPAAKVGLAAGVAGTAAGITALVVPPLAPILLPTAVCLSLVSSAAGKHEELSDIWAKSKLIANECDSIKASYERDFNTFIQKYGTEEEVIANRQRYVEYQESIKPDMPLVNFASEESVMPSSLPSAHVNYSLFKAEVQSKKQEKDKPDNDPESSPLDKKH